MSRGCPRTVSYTHLVTGSLRLLFLCRSAQPNHEEGSQQEQMFSHTQVYDALKEKGYSPVNQLVGYILSEDPTYITTYKNACSMIRKVDRDDLLQAMLRSYLNV